MRAALRFLYRIICVLLVASGLLIGVVACCCISALAIVWVQEGRLLPPDKQLLTESFAWLGGAGLFVYVIARLTKLIGGRDDSFRLRKTSPKVGAWTQGITLLFFFLILARWVWPTLSGPPIVKSAALVGWLIIGFVGLHVQIILHELGHCTAAWLLRFNRKKMQIGVGPHVWSGSLAIGLRFEWRALPLGGFMTAADPTTSNFRLRQFVFIAAGPLADLIVLWLGCWFYFSAVPGSAFPTSPGGVLVGLMLLWIALSFIGGITPQRARLGDRVVWTDGYWLWTLVRAPANALATLAAQIKWHQAIESAGSREIPPWLAPASLPVASANAAESLASFRSQHLRLSSILLRQARQ